MSQIYRYRWVFKSVKFNFTYTDKIQSKWEKNIPKSPLSRSWRPRIFRPVKSTQKIASQQDRCFGWPTCCFGIRMVCLLHYLGWCIWYFWKVDVYCEEECLKIFPCWLCSVEIFNLEKCKFMQLNFSNSQRNGCWYANSARASIHLLSPSTTPTRPENLQQKKRNNFGRAGLMIYSQGPWFTHCAATAL